MSNTFAKLFNIGDSQILCTTETSDADEPQIKFDTEYKGLRVATAIGFKADSGGDDMRDKKFLAVDQDFAVGLLKLLRNLVDNP